MNVVRVRDIMIGEGMTKTCVPVAYKTADEIVQQMTILAGQESADFVEWRTDWYDDIFDESALVALLSRIRDILQNKPLLFTFRSAEEGGKKLIRAEQYEKMLKTVIETGTADLIDLESHFSGELIQNVLSCAHANGVKVIISAHEFTHTPAKEVMVERMCQMQELGADICKLAVMPVCERDVLTLLDATLTMRDTYATVPLITMSMSAMGVISRLSGDTFGSAVSFGSMGRASAPGQIGVDELRSIIEIVNR